MLHPPTLGKDISDLIEYVENTIIEAVYIPKELMSPTGEVSSAHMARLLQEAKMRQLYGPDIPSERERIEKRWVELKQEAKRYFLMKRLVRSLKTKIAAG